MSFQQFTKRLFILFSLLFFIGITAQTEWIDYDQTYYKIKVAEDKLYKIPFEVLQESGLPANTTGYHLYRMGEEIPVFFSNENALQSGDYLAFYGQKNDGSFDTQLYAQPSHQLHPHHSLFTDTITYFLMYDGSFEGLRYETVENDLTNLPPVETSFEATFQREFQQGFFNGKSKTLNRWKENSQQWEPFDFYATTYEENEGFLSSILLMMDDRNYFLPISSEQITGDSLELYMKIVGRSNDRYWEGEQHGRVFINDILIEDFIFEGYNYYEFNVKIPVDFIQAEGNIMRVNNVGDIWNTSETMGSISRFSLSHFELKYPKVFDFDSLAIYPFSIEGQEEKYFEVNNFVGETNTLLLDLSNHQKIEIPNENEAYPIHLPEGFSLEEKRKLVLVNPENEAAISIVENIDEQVFIDYSLAENQGNYILISHPKLRESFEGIDQVANYADYRRSLVGGNFEVVEVNVEDLYHQYAYGIGKHPMSIQSFINRALEEWTIEPKHLLLLGKGTRYQHLKPNTNSSSNIWEDCLIPTFGAPGNDFFFGCPSPTEIDFQIPVGRISVNTPEEIATYFEKIQSYESVFFDSKCLEEKPEFFNKILQNNNSYSENKVATYNADTEILAETLMESIWQPQYDIVSGVSQTWSDEGIINEINEGVNLISYYGDSNGQFLTNFGDFNLLENSGKYPILYCIAPYISDMYKPKPLDDDYSIFSEELIWLPNTGAIAVIGNTKFGINHHYNFLNHNTQNFFRNFSTDLYGESLGEILRTTLNQTYQELPDSINFLVDLINLNGDPAIRFAQYLLPDYRLKQGEFYDLLTTSTITEADEEIFLALDLLNTARLKDEIINYSVIRTLPDGTEMLVKEDTVSLGFEEQATFYISIPKEPFVEGINAFEIQLDPNTALAEECKSNNTWTEEVLYETANALENLRAVGELKVSPNPSKDKVNVISPFRIVELELSNANGEVVLKETPNSNRTETSIKDLSSGVYLLKMIGENGLIKTQKIIKK